MSKQSWSWWFETPSRSLWRHYNDQVCGPFGCAQAAPIALVVVLRHAYWCHIWLEVRSKTNVIVSGDWPVTIWAMVCSGATDCVPIYHEEQGVVSPFPGGVVWLSLSLGLKKNFKSICTVQINYVPFCARYIKLHYSWNGNSCDLTWNDVDFHLNTCYHS